MNSGGRRSSVHPGDLHPQRTHLSESFPALISSSLRWPRIRQDICLQTCHIRPSAMYDLTGERRTMMRILIPVRTSAAPYRGALSALEQTSDQIDPPGRLDSSRFRLSRLPRLPVTPWL